MYFRSIPFLSVQGFPVTVVSLPTSKLLNQEPTTGAYERREYSEAEALMLV